MRAVAGLMVLLAMPAVAQDRPNEADMFGEVAPAASVDAGVSDAPSREADLFSSAQLAADAGSDRDQAQLSDGKIESKFDSDEVKSDPLKIGGTMNFFGQGFWQEGRPFEKGSFSAPFLLDAFIDGRPNDRVRGFASARLQFDPTKPSGSASTSPTVGNTALVGLTPATQNNPSIQLDQLWLRFDVLRKVYVTIGRQKVRWGVSRIWYPTDFLNSQPRDALNPLDVRLGVNMLKLHVPIESLGWNFYAYGLMDAVNLTSTGVTIDQLGGAVRGEFVLGPAELGVGGVWQKGRRPRYAVDLSSSLGPVDVYGEAAFRDARDFTLFRYPSDLTADNLVSRIGDITAYRPEGIMVQVSGGASLQFNYTDKNMAILTAEYFYNPAGYTDPTGYQVKTFMPGLLGVKLDPIQSVSLYGGQHNLAVTLAAPGIPGFDWITVSLSNIIIMNDPSALTRLDVIFRVLTYLNVQVFGAVFYGQTGGQLRFSLTSQQVNDIANLSELGSPGTGDALRTQLSTLRYAPIVQAGVLLRISI